MKKLKSLKSFIEENQEVEKIEMISIKGGKTIAIAEDTVKFYEKDTMDSWNCADCCTYAVGDGLYGTDCP